MIRTLPLVFALACGPAEEPASIDTSRLIFDATISSQEEASADAIVTLREEGSLESAFYELEIGEEVTVTFPGIVISLFSGQFEKQPVYTASIPEPPVDVEFVFALNRVPPNKTAHDSRVSLPLGFEVTAPTAFSRSADFEVSWSIFDQFEPLVLEVNGPCIDTFQEEIPDIGVFTVEAGSVTGDGDCPTSMSLTRARRGVLDNQFADGSVLAVQQRSLSLTSNP